MYVCIFIDIIFLYVLVNNQHHAARPAPTLHGNVMWFGRIPTKTNRITWLCWEHTKSSFPIPHLFIVEGKVFLKRKRNTSLSTSFVYTKKPMHHRCVVVLITVNNSISSTPIKTNDSYNILLHMLSMLFIEFYDCMILVWLMVRKRFPSKLL